MLCVLQCCGAMVRIMHKCVYTRCHSGWVGYYLSYLTTANAWLRQFVCLGLRNILRIQCCWCCRRRCLPLEKCNRNRHKKSRKENMWKLKSIHRQLPHLYRIQSTIFCWPMPIFSRCAIDCCYIIAIFVFVFLCFVLWLPIWSGKQIHSYVNWLEPILWRFVYDYIVRSTRARWGDKT